MIKAAKYNGINFSDDFKRKSSLINFDLQRVKNYLNRDIEIKAISFESSSEEYSELFCIDENLPFSMTPDSITFLPDGKYVHNFIIPADYLPTVGSQVYFKVAIGADVLDNEVLFSEIYEVQDNDFFAENGICKLTGYNNDATHGYNTSTYPAFGFFKKSELNRDIFINEKTEYEYSYGRKMVLGSENQIAKRITFHSLSMYQQNLLKWICNCENLYIDGVKYQLISDFTELLKDENTEVCDLRADFVEAEQSFFRTGASKPPTNVFPKAFFMK